MTKVEVIQTVLEEREYQDKKWGNLDEKNNLADFLCYMETYLTEAKRLNNPENPNPAMHKVRRLIALGFAASEKFGLPRREYDL